jgi:hypothetical protein
MTEKCAQILYIFHVAWTHWGNSWIPIENCASDTEYVIF